MDQLFQLGWFPTELETRVRSHISELAADSEDTRRAARTALGETPRFVVIPELIRGLDSNSETIREECASLLKDWTAEYLDRDLMGYAPDSSPQERDRAISELWKWWQAVRQDF